MPQVISEKRKLELLSDNQLRPYLDVILNLSSSMLFTKRAAADQLTYLCTLRYYCLLKINLNHLISLYKIDPRHRALFLSWSSHSICPIPRLALLDHKFGALAKKDALSLAK